MKIFLLYIKFIERFLNIKLLENNTLKWFQTKTP